MTKVNHTWHVLAVRDLQESTAFYTEVLGCELGIAPEGWQYLSLGAFRLMLGECRDEVPASETNNHSYFAYVNIEGIDELYPRCKNNGARFVKELTDEPWGMREFGIVTPDGHRIMFGEDVDG